MPRSIMLEIDVDIGGLVALGRDEAREEQIELHRIDRGHAEDEAYDRVRCRSSALAQDRRIATPREPHYVMLSALGIPNRPKTLYIRPMSHIFRTIGEWPGISL